MARNIKELAQDIKNILKDHVSKMVFIKRELILPITAQLAIFIRGIDQYVSITEKMANPFPMKVLLKVLQLKGFDFNLKLI